MSRPMSAFEVEYTITSDDAVDVSWTYGRSTRRKTILIAGAVAVVALAIWFVSSFALAFGIFVGATLLVLLSISRLPLKLFVRWTPATRVGTKVSLALTPDGIAVRYDGVSGMVEWRAVTRILEDARAIVLLQGKAPVALISKRALGSSDAVEAFKREVRTYAPGGVWDQG